jgi:hypothetical protein
MHTGAAGELPKPLITTVKELKRCKENASTAELKERCEEETTRQHHTPLENPGPRSTKWMEKRRRRAAWRLG